MKMIKKKNNGILNTIIHYLMNKNIYIKNIQYHNIKHHK